MLKPTALLRICLVGLLLAGAALALGACNRSKNSTPAYEAAPVKKGDITQVVTATGTLSALVSVDVGSQISGRILKLSVDFNSQVKKGDVVAQIDPAIYQAVVDQSQGELENSRAGLELSRLTVERKRSLMENRAGTQADFDKANAEFLQARAMVTIKQAQLDRAKADLANCRIEAPVDGIVISRKVDIGQTVAAAMTTPVLYTIAQDIKKMHIVASVSEADIGQVAVGQTVEFSVEAFPDDVFYGTVAQVRKAATTTNNVVTYDTVIDVENPEQKLFPGMTAEVSIYVAERKGVLTVPNASLRFVPPDGAKFDKAGPPPAKVARGQRIVYFPVGDKGSELKAVLTKIGVTDGVNSEVLEGLKENERVVTATSNNEKKGPFGGSK